MKKYDQQRTSTDSEMQITVKELTYESTAPQQSSNRQALKSHFIHKLKNLNFKKPHRQPKIMEAISPLTTI